jgi:hypothetical protein
LFQPLWIDIHEHDGAILQSRREQDVVAKIMGEDKAASPNESDLNHRGDVVLLQPVRPVLTLI